MTHSPDSFTAQFSAMSFPRLGLVRFPEVAISLEDRLALKLKPGASNRDVLASLAWAGYQERDAKGRFKAIPRAQVVERFKTEFATFDKTGVVPYLLLVWDIVRWAQREGIVMGWGRGSAGGSLTNYCLGITKVNPIEYDLDFPRFLSEARMKPVVKDGVTYVDGKSAPDIDMDFQFGRRADVVRYIEAKYAGRTCKISTRMELTGKMALKDTLKVYAGYTEEEAKRVSDLIEARFGKVQTLHEARDKNEDVQKWLKADAAHEEIYAIAMAIEGLVIGKGQHPSGVFIAYDPLDGNIPVELSKTKEVVTTYDMETVAGLGIKVDILGVRTLDLVANTAELGGESLDDLDMEDPALYQYLRERDTYVGLFQIAEGVTKEATMKIKPRHMRDLSAVLAISRPGAMKYIDQFATYVRTGEVKPFYPGIDDVLKPTGGALIMQEQITAICRDVFGLSGVDADQVRYCVSGDTPFVSKTRGWITIDRLLSEGYAGDQFLVMDEHGHQSWGEIDEIWSNGLRTVRSVTTKCGLSVRATPHHQFLTDRGWKTAHWLDKDEDMLVGPGVVEYDGRDDISPSLAIVIAGLVAEGYCPVNKRGGTFVNHDPEMGAMYQQHFTAVFGHPAPTADGRVYRFNKPHGEVFYRHMRPGLARSKRLPEVMMGMTKESTRQFLSFLLACEGGNSCTGGMDRQFEFASASVALVRQVQLLLLRFGIYATVAERAVRGYEDNGPYYRLFIQSRDHQQRLRDELTCMWPSVKRAQLDANLSGEREHMSYGDMVPSSIVQRFLWQHSHLFSRRGTNQGERLQGRDYTEAFTWEKFRRYCAVSQDPQWLAFCEGRQRYHYVQGMNNPQKEVEVFDFRMKDPARPFIVAGGLIIHNCIGKKKRELMEPWEAVLSTNGRARGIPEAIIRAFWDVCNASADYSFNLSHAVLYAHLTAATVSLKARHPQAFYLSMLKLANEEPNPIEYMNGVIAEMRAVGIQLLPPDLIKSEADFTIQDGHVRFGLSHIKGISEANMRKVASFKRDFESKFAIFEAAKAAKLDIRTLTGLIYCGCLDSVIYDGSSRAKLALEAQLYNLLTPNEKVLAKRYRDEYREDLLALIKGVAEKRDEKGRALIKESRMETLRRDYAPAWAAYQSGSRWEDLTMCLAERAYLGFSYTASLFDCYARRMVGLVSLKDLIAKAAALKAGAAPVKETLKTVAFVQEGKACVSAKGSPYWRATVFDDDGSMTVLLHGEEKMEACRSYNGDIPKAGAIVTVTGSLSKDGGVLFAESVVEQVNPLRPSKTVAEI